MDPEDPLTPLEQNLGARLGQYPQGPCLNAADLVALAVLGNRSPHYDSDMAHIVTCPSCRVLLRRFQAIEAAGNRANSAGRANPRTRLLTVGALATALLAVVFVLSAKRTVVTLQDNGGQIRLTASNSLSGLPNLTSAQQNEIVAVLQSGHVPVPAVLTDLRPPTGSTATMAFPVTAPHATVVATPQPEFAWKMPPKAVSCRILLASLTDPKQIVHSRPLTADHWKPKKPLVPGQIYTWQVVALDRNGKELARVPAQANTAKFKVLEKDRNADLEQARTTSGGSHLAMGVLYTQEGLLDDAEREFQALHQTNPNSPLARRLLESVHALRG